MFNPKNLKQVTFDEIEVGKKYIVVNPCLYYYILVRVIEVLTRPDKNGKIKVKIAIGNFPPYTYLLKKEDLKKRCNLYQDSSDQAIDTGDRVFVHSLEAYNWITKFASEHDLLDWLKFFKVPNPELVVEVVEGAAHDLLNMVDETNRHKDN